MKKILHIGFPDGKGGYIATGLLDNEAGTITKTNVAFFKTGLLDEHDMPMTEVRNERGELIIVLREPADVKAMETAGLDPSNEDDMVIYVNHLCKTNFDTWAPA